MLEQSEGLPEGPRGLPEGPEGLLEGSKGLPERTEGLPGGLRLRMYKQTYRWTLDVRLT